MRHITRIARHETVDLRLLPTSPLLNFIAFGFFLQLFGANAPHICSHRPNEQFSGSQALGQSKANKQSLNKTHLSVQTARSSVAKRATATNKKVSIGFRTKSQK